ncbi:MAG: hypothetical protein Q9O62_00940 [Ardenticatenia bacterium]|nr:hypothetical protein [Ardenticatenia bacterium]
MVRKGKRVVEIGRCLVVVLWLAVLGVGVAHAGSCILGANVQVTDDGLNTTEFGEANKPDVAATGNAAISDVWEDNRDAPSDPRSRPGMAAARPGQVIGATCSWW